jgi:Lrp/AsnC family transcriptional regulator for asnA, asnC and gidA
MVDSRDEKIINILVKDARQSSQKVAKRLRINSSTVRRRVNRLVHNGVMRIVAVPDPDALGYEFKAVIAFDVSHEKLNSVIEVLASQPEIKWAAATTGRFDVMALGWFTSAEALYEFLEKKVSKLEGIRDSETFICLNIKKSF